MIPELSTAVYLRRCRLKIRSRQPPSAIEDPEGKFQRRQVQDRSAGHLGHARGALPRADAWTELVARRMVAAGRAAVR